MTIDEIRRDTPGCLDKLFVNSAGASLVPIQVIKSVQEYLATESLLGGYYLSDHRTNEIDRFYEVAAELLNTKPRNIAFCHDATDAYTKALSSIAFNDGDVILTTDDDYVSNHLNFLALQRRVDIRVVRSNNLPNGDLDLGSFRDQILKHRPKLVSVTHIPTNSGLIQEVDEIGRTCRESGAIYLVDACQSVGQIPVDVMKIQCDFLSATGRKFLRGPRGTGLLYVGDRMLHQNSHPLFVDLHGAQWTSANSYELRDDAGRFEYWEKPYALMFGLSEAISYALKVGLDRIEQINADLMSHFRELLLDQKDVQLFDLGSKKAAILTFRKNGKSLNETTTFLDAHKVFYSVARRDNALIDFDKKGIDWAIRLSPHYFNTKEELERVADIIRQL